MWGEPIRRLREQRGWSQDELAKRVGMTQQQISLIEKSRRVPDVDQYDQIARAFGYRVGDFLPNSFGLSIASVGTVGLDIVTRLAALGLEERQAAIRAIGAMLDFREASVSKARQQASDAWTGDLPDLLTPEHPVPPARELLEAIATYRPETQAVFLRMVEWLREAFEEDPAILGDPVGGFDSPEQGRRHTKKLLQPIAHLIRNYADLVGEDPAVESRRSTAREALRHHLQDVTYVGSRAQFADDMYERMKGHPPNETEK
jgi:putative transcriptional regulator